MGQEGELTVNLALAVAAPPERVWQALTDPAELAAWLAEAEVDLAAGRYALRGTGLPEAPAQSPTRLLAAEPPRQLRFGWDLRGSATEVEIRLEPGGAGCRLTLAHSGLRQRPQGKGGTTDFWVVALENLRLHLAGREPVRCDFTPRGAQVDLRIEVEAPREALFGTLLDPAALDEFWSSGAQVEPRVGGAYSYGWASGGPAKILELEPGARLVTDWSYRGEPPTVVTWELAGSGGRTRLTLAHTGFDPGDEREDYRLGWLGFLAPLKARAELGTQWSRIETDGYAVEDPG